MRTFIASHKIDLIILDPLVKTHSSEENDNSAVDAVACILARLAADMNCAVDVLHHERKAGSPEAGDANRGRGASSFRDATRLLYTLTPMTEAEREQFGLSEDERRSLVRVDSAKVNIAPPSIDAQWFRIVGVPLDNGTALYPHGDTVPTVEPWDAPDLWRDLPVATANAILDQIERGPGEGRRYSPARQAPDDRAAWRVVQDHCAHLNDKQSQTVISTWIKKRWLRAASTTIPASAGTAPGCSSSDGRDENPFANRAARAGRRRAASERANLSARPDRTAPAPRRPDLAPGRLVLDLRRL
jgi:AAA domain